MGSSMPPNGLRPGQDGVKNSSGSPGRGVPELFLTPSWPGLNPFGGMLVPMQRTLVLGAAWLGSAAAGVGLGFLAVDTGAGVSPADEMATAGGTVYASCAGGTPDLASAPAAGWSVDDSSDPGKVEFRSGTQQVEVRVTCVAGAPQFAVEGGTAAATSPSAPSATQDSGGGHGADDPAGDDSSGRGGGGHGSDG